MIYCVRGLDLSTDFDSLSSIYKSGRAIQALDIKFSALVRPALPLFSGSNVHPSLSEDGHLFVVLRISIIALARQ